MKTALKPSAYSMLEKEYSIDLSLTTQQIENIEKDEAFILDNQQMDSIIDQLVAVDGLDGYILKTAEEIQPISISLFVINDRLWKMMERKPWDTDKMLAMCTIPLCTWDQKEESTSNPKGVKRWEIKQNHLELSFDEKPILTFTGEGGDFSGFIEQSQITGRKFGMIESRKLVPNYMFEDLKMEIRLNDIVIELHPEPKDDLDYDFSEHARVFYECGCAISLRGNSVRLTVGKRKPAILSGDIYLLLGINAKSDDHYRELKSVLWLNALKRKLGGK